MKTPHLSLWRNGRRVDVTVGSQVRVGVPVDGAFRHGGGQWWMVLDIRRPTGERAMWPGAPEYVAALLAPNGRQEVVPVGMIARVHQPE